MILNVNFFFFSVFCMLFVSCDLLPSAHYCAFKMMYLSRRFQLLIDWEGRQDEKQKLHCCRVFCRRRKRLRREGN